LHFLDDFDIPSDIKVDYGIFYGDTSDEESNKIWCLTLGGGKENFYISFDDYLTAIFINNEEFMLIDDIAKKSISADDTYDNIVYEGSLRDKTHKEIFQIICEFIKILNNTKSISFSQESISHLELEYPKYNYVVNLFKNDSINYQVILGNITFNITSVNVQK
jgi:hypothetical protein